MPTGWSGIKIPAISPSTVIAAGADLFHNRVAATRTPTSELREEALSFAQLLNSASKFNNMHALHTFHPQDHKTKVSGFHIRVKTGYSQLDQIDLIDNYSKVLHTLTGTQVTNFSNLLDNTDFFKKEHSYRQIKDDALWREVYKVEDVMWRRLDPTHGLCFDNIPAVFCRQCGIEIPLRVASVDHQGAQTGGESKAVLRFFRAIGCTESTAKSRKGAIVLARFAAALGGDANTRLSGATDRYTLNVMGRMYYTMILKVYGDDSDFKKMCMHALTNLRPVCPPCNSKLQNSGVF